MTDDPPLDDGYWADDDHHEPRDLTHGELDALEAMRAELYQLPQHHPPAGAPAKLAPYDDASERALLGAVMLSYEAAEQLSELTPADFYVPTHQHAWAALQTLYEAGDPLDAVSVGAQLQRDGLAWAGMPGDLIAWQANCPATSSAGRYAKVVHQHALERAIMYRASDVIELARRGNVDQALEQLARATALAAGATSDSRTFAPIDLAALIDAEPVPPRFVTPWVYAEALTVLQSEPSVGKSWLALWQTLQAVDLGFDVVYIDEEGGEELVIERLQALQATAEQLAHVHYFAFEQRTWDAADVAALDAYLAQLERNGARPGFGVFDSLPDFLAAADLDENSATDVTRFVRTVCGALRQRGWAQLMLDHLAKPPPGAASKTKSPYSRGSGAKLAKAGCTILVERSEEFDRTSSGVLKVWKTKDRRGALPLPNLTKPPQLLAMTVHQGTLSIGTTTVNDDPEHAHDHADRGPTHAMAAISRLLATTEEPLSQRQVEALANFKGKVVRTALERLVHGGYVQRTTGARGAKLHLLVRPYLLTDQAQADRDDDSPDERPFDYVEQF